MTLRLNMKTVVVGALAALLVCVAVLGWRAHDVPLRIHSSTTEAMLARMSASELATAIGGDLTQLRLAEAAHVMAGSPAARQRTLGDMRRATDALTRHQTAFRDLPPSDEERALLAEFRLRFQSYAALDGQLVEVMARGEPQTASQLYNGRMLAEFEAIGPLIARLAEAPRAQAEAAMADSGRAFRLVQRDSLVVWGLAGAAMAAAAAFIVFGFWLPQTRIAAAMAGVARGSLDSNIPYGSRRDDIGELARLALIFRDTLAELGRLRARQAEADCEAAASQERRDWTADTHAAATTALREAESDEALMSRICQAIVTQPAFVLALVGITDESDGKPVHVVCAEGAARDYADKLSLSWSGEHARGCGATGTCIRTGRPQVVSVGHSSVSGYQGAATDHGIRSICALPLSDGARTFGALNVYSTAADTFDAQMVAHLEHLAEQMAFAMHSRAMRRTVEELEQSLVQARKLETLGRMAGGLAHDFNNLLAAILGFSEFISQDLPADHRCSDHAARIRLAAGRGKALVEQVLAFTRQGELKRHRFSLAETVTETMALLRPVVPPPLLVRGDIGCPDVMAEADKGQLVRILMNLCINARDAMAENSGCITIALRDTDLQRPAITRLKDPMSGPVEVWTDGTGTNWAVSGIILATERHVSLVVSDNGHGMSRDVLARAFEPFFTTKGRARGSGLGLAVVQDIILGHGGALIVRTQPGTGTDVEIVLPVASGTGNSAGDIGGTTQSRVLLADDD
ncbi:MAG TPA: ATP-binding protein, partial [Magnetospirillum sp.]|nr:ATP-binding protein [Magnetospirillum sp.]